MKSAARANREKRKTIVPKGTEYQGICFSCTNLIVCIFIKGSSQPVMFCEEFANDGIAMVTSTREKQEAFTEYKVSTEGHKGLCVTCENCDNCSFTKQEGGVWHCEEYQ
jgi:hypothetical protein